MKKTLSHYFLFVFCILCPGLVHAQQYVYTNDNLFPGTNSVTALGVNKAGMAKRIHTYSTGGLGTGTASPGAPTIVFAGNKSAQCLFVANGGSDSIAAFTVAPSTGSLTLVPGSPFPSGAGEAGDIILALGLSQLLFAGDSHTIRVLSVNSDCSLSPPLNTYPVLGPAGMKATPDGKFLISTAFGPNEVFSVDYSNATLTDLGTVTSQGAPLGVEISCDSSTVYFGDAVSNETQIEVFSISSTGQLSEINNFIDSHGQDSSSVVLSSDEKTLYVGNNLSRQITALSVGQGSELTYGSTIMLNHFNGDLLGLAMGRSGSYLFGLEQNDPEKLSVVAVSGTMMMEVIGSPFPILHDPFAPGSLVTVPGKVCK
jgi:hypothetical protein